MGAFSVWHWIIVLVVFLGGVLLPVALARKDKTLARLPYFWRVLGIWAFWLIGSYVAPLLGAGEAQAAMKVAMALMVLIGVVALQVLITLWSVHRIQHIGHARWWALLFLVPLVNIAYLIFLLFYPGQETAVTAEA